MTLTPHLERQLAEIVADDEQRQWARISARDRALVEASEARYGYSPSLRALARMGSLVDARDVNACNEFGEGDFAGE